MADKEKLIRAMEYCTGDIVPVDENDECLGDVCPFKEGGYESGDCQENMIRDALALLQEQEARVMTLEEIKRLEVLDVLWLQITGGYEGSVYSAFPVVIYMIGKHHVDFWGRGGRDFSFYNHRVNGWRLWTSRPTPEQMRDTKWEGEESDA